MISLRYRRVAWLIALIAVLGAGVVAYFSRQRAIALDAEVRRTLAVREAVAGTLALLADAETGQRGFLLTGDPVFLEPDARARAKLASQVNALRDATRTDAHQDAAVRRIESLSALKLAELDETIAMRRAGKVDQALAVVREGRGRRLMDDIRAASTQMLEREQTTLDQRRQATTDAARRSSIAVMTGLGLAVLVVLAALATVRRDMDQARAVSLETSERDRVFRLLADNASDLIRILDGDGSHLYVSPSSRRLLGYRAEELRALSPESLLPDEDRQAFLSGQGDQTSHGTQSIVHRMRSKNGSYRWFETRIAPALYQDGKPRMLFASRDITGRKQAEDDLRRQKALLQSIVTNMGDGLVVLDVDRKFVMINPAIQPFFTQQEGDRASSSAWSTETTTFLPDAATVFPPEEGPLTRALAGEPSDGVEIVMRNETAGERRFSVTARAIRDAEKITGAVAVFHDITEQRRAEHDLLESEQRWRVFSEASFEGMVVTRAGHILDTNATFASWLGRDPSDLVGMDGFSNFVAEDRERARSASADGQAGAYEARLRRKDGTAFPVEVRGRAVLFRGQPVRIAVIRDVTERKAQEAELARRAERLRELSLRDELTQLYNRRGFLELAQQQLLLSNRAQRHFAVFYADLNGMKIINDQLGHEMGDRALVATGKILNKVFRASDIVARLGGDEFAVLASECDAEGVKAAVARLRRLIDDHNVIRGVPFQLSVSLGAAVYDPAAPVGLQALMRQADEQMYEFKRARRAQREGRGTATGS